MTRRHTEVRTPSRQPAGASVVARGASLPSSGAMFTPVIDDDAPPAAPTLWPYVRRAAAALRSCPVDVDPETYEGDTVDSIDALLVAWRRCLDGGSPDAHGVSLVRRRTIERLQSGFLRELAKRRDHPDGGELVRMLAALGRVREHVEGDEAQQFRRMFAGRSAMDLVVEVSHDMRSPLSAILLLTDTLRRAPAEVLSPSARRQVGIVYGAAFGLHAMANDLIELGRGGEQLVDAEPTSLSIGEIMEGVGDIVRPMAEEKQLTLHFTRPTMDSRIGHPLALSRVLVNLTTNALKYTREGGVRVIATELSRTAVELAVEDTGVGIPEEVLASLWQPVRRRAPDSAFPRAFSSAGLGLAICRRLVRGMGSELRVQSEPGKGTRFSFQLSLPPACHDFDLVAGDSDRWPVTLPHQQPREPAVGAAGEERPHPHLLAGRVSAIGTNRPQSAGSRSSGTPA